MTHFSVGRRFGATITTVMHTIAILVTILGIANQSADNGTSHCTSSCPGRTFDCTKTTAG